MFWREPVCPAPAIFRKATKPNEAENNDAQYEWPQAGHMLQ